MEREREMGVFLFLPKLLERGKVEREKKEVQETGAQISLGRIFSLFFLLLRPFDCRVSVL
jgi:hypothetical protein